MKAELVKEILELIKNKKVDKNTLGWGTVSLSVVNLTRPNPGQNASLRPKFE